MIEIIGGKGSILFDSTGKEFINFSESTNILGYANTDLMSIIQKKLSEGMIHYPLTISRNPDADSITSKLLQIASMEGGTGVYSSSGSEAADIALTCLTHLGPVILVNGHYHGNTGQYEFKDKNDRTRYGREYNISFPSNNDISEVEDAVKCGARSIIIEPLQVEGGIREIPSDFIEEISRSFPDLFVCIDEAYTGFGKTGDFFSYQKHDIKPDIVIIGKAIGGGIPLGLTLFSKRSKEEIPFISKYRNGAFGSSSGNRVALALGKHILGIVSSREFLEEVKRKGKIMEKLLGEAKDYDLTGRGLIRGIDLLSKKPAEITERIISNGVFVTQMSGRIRLSPPLNISDDLIEESAKRILRALK
jgi:acetylornithine/N-succinyldiaminopimelate aminotransferase